MPLDKIPIISKTVHFSVERSPDDTGIVFVYKQNNRKKVAAMLIDQGDNFCFVTIDHRGIYMTEFNPETVLMLKNGKPAPLEAEQMEVYTPFGRHLLVRHLYADERPAGVIVACREGDFLTSVLVCGETEDRLCFMLAK